MLQLIFIFLVITLFLFFYLSVKHFVSNQGSISRLKKYTNFEEIKEEKRRVSKRDSNKELNFIAKTVGNVKFLDGYKKGIQLRLMRAHILLKAEEFISISIGLFCFMSFLLFLLTQSLLLTIGGGILGWLIPTYVINIKTKKRLKLLNDQLCDAIVLISNALKAGYSFFQAVDAVAKEMTGPIAEEFMQLQKEMNLGVATEKALEGLVERANSDDLELVITAVLIQRQVGGNLSIILDNISSTIRERINIKAEVKTITAQGRISGLIIAVLPVILGIILYIINPEHIGLLFKNPIGIAILGFSVLMELVGIYFISKIVKIEM